MKEISFKFNEVRVEFTSSASDKKVAPESLIQLFTEEKHNLYINYINNLLNSKDNEVRDELTLSADDNEDAPESPIWFHMKRNAVNKHRIVVIDVVVIPRFNEWRDELTVSADDNEDAPESPILLPSTIKMKIQHSFL